ncbi:MAG: hypothetical protein Q8R82_08465 [Hyphomonadaceae bacterium]|nr:hypothetical protein [Hyphomonadaceae bacterium]
MENRKDGPAGSVEDSARRVRDAAGEVVTDAKHASLQGVEDARAKAGDKGHSTATRLRELASHVEGDMPWMATAFTKSADGLDSVTNSLTQGDLKHSLSGVTDFAKRQPAIFLGASVALGFALARVGKAALEQSHASAAPQPARERAPFDGIDSPYPTRTEI